MFTFRMSGTRTGWRTRTRLGAVGLTLGITLGVLAAGVPGSNAAVSRSRPVVGGLVVRTANGTVRGVAKGPVDEFLGMPYAAPPGGTLRWQPPRPATRWAGVRDATRLAPNCAQPAGPFGTPSTSEDCLYLNVYTPIHRQADSPVMIWIPGGGFHSGAAGFY